MPKGSFHCRTKFMFVVAGMPFDSRMCSRNPTTARRPHSTVLGKNFRERICELATQCSNIAVGTHALPPIH
jgi:hypothetical protein